MKTPLVLSVALTLLTACGGGGGGGGTPAPPPAPAPPPTPPAPPPPPAPAPPPAAANPYPPLQPGLYFAADPEAEALRKDGASVQLPWPGNPTTRFEWKLANALRMVGWGNRRLLGARIDAAQFRSLEAELVNRERLFLADTARMPDFHLNWGPPLPHNVPREFGVHVMVRSMALFNEGTRSYQRLSPSCMVANLLPAMRGALVNMGAADGSDWNDPAAPLRDPQIVQMPELFSFNNRRTAITASELPAFDGVPMSACSYAATLVHEFTHDLDLRFNGSGSEGYMNQQIDRRQACGPQLMDFDESGSPFKYEGAAGTQPLADFISGYAAGLLNSDRTYRPWEDAAETVTAYLLFPEYFRELASKSAALRARYDYVRTRLFGGVEFRNLAAERGAFKVDDGNLSVDRQQTTASVCNGFAEFRLDDIVKR